MSVKHKLIKDLSFHPDEITEAEDFLKDEFPLAYYLWSNIEKEQKIYEYWIDRGK